MRTIHEISHHIVSLEETLCNRFIPAIIAYGMDEHCSIQHCMSCKKGDFVSMKHNDLRDLTANMLSEVCKDIEIEPQLIPLTSEGLGSRTANTTNEARLDIRAREFGKEDFKHF